MRGGYLVSLEDHLSARAPAADKAVRVARGAGHFSRRQPRQHIFIHWLQER